MSENVTYFVAYHAPHWWQSELGIASFGMLCGFVLAVLWIARDILSRMDGGK